jgi:glutamate synthase (NADPH/NADH) large chain
MGTTGIDPGCVERERRERGDGERSVAVRAGDASAVAARGDTADPGVPAARGLYDPALDRDSCGVGFIADIKGC